MLSYLHLFNPFKKCVMSGHVQINTLDPNIPFKEKENNNLQHLKTSALYTSSSFFTKTPRDNYLMSENTCTAH